MNIKALITSLVLGSSALAVATPAFASPDIRDHRSEPVVLTPAIQSHLRTDMQINAAWHGNQPQRPVFVRPVVLASSARIQGRDVIRVNEQRAFTKLELRSKSGRTQLDKVMIQFGNGQTQVIDCAKQLSGGESFSIDLYGNARNIKKITLVGKSGRRASLDVIAV